MDYGTPASINSLNSYFPPVTEHSFNKECFTCFIYNYIITFYMYNYMNKSISSAVKMIYEYTLFLTHKDKLHNRLLKLSNSVTRNEES